MNKKIFSLVLIGIILTGTGLGIYLYWNLSQRPTVQLLEKKNSSKETINLNGKVKSKNEVDLGFEIGGKITEIDCAVGERVSSGAILAKIDGVGLSSQYQAAWNQVESAQEILKKNKALVKAAKYKLKSLKDSEANSNDIKEQKAQILADQFTVDSQEAQVRSLINSVQALKNNLGKTVLRAPFDGLIIKQDGKVGEIAVSNAANPLPIMTLVDENNFEIESYASLREVRNIFVGQKAEVILDNEDGKTFSAQVVSIDPAATLVDNVSVYKITLEFSDRNFRPELGMGAGILINPKKP